MACGLPIDTTDGECSTGASIGPICSSILRVSANSSASGMSYQANLGVPMSTVIMPVVMLLAEQDAGDGLEGEALPALLGGQRLHHAAHAVAAGLRRRAVGIDDLDIVGCAGRARIMDGHDLVEPGARRRH